MPNLLVSEKNRYQGRWVNEYLPDDACTFERDLCHSLDMWQDEGIKVIWLTITADRANLIPTALASGFTFHHTNSNRLILTKQLIENAVFPDFANHTLGVGSIVFNDKNEVLTVVEKHDQKDRPGHWKFPGGAVDNGELIRDAAIREVFEETSIKSEFVNMVGMRHYHRGQFGTSNIYVVCQLKALSEDIICCPNEIAKAKWFTIDEYLSTDSVIAFNKAFLRAALTGKGMPDIDLGDLHGTPVGEYEIFTQKA